MFSRVQVFLRPGFSRSGSRFLGSGSRVRVQVVEVAAKNDFTFLKKVTLKLSKSIKAIKICSRDLQ